MTDSALPATSDHLPRTPEALAALDVRERVMLSVAAASGSDAVAYYAADGKGGFKQTDHMDIYDLNHQHPTSFPPTLKGFESGTFANETAVRTISDKNENYQMAVTGKDGKIKGIIVLHPPQTGYMKVRDAAGDKDDAAWKALSDEERTKQNKSLMPNLYEAATVRLHKLQMAYDIVQQDKGVLLKEGDKVLKPGQAVGSLAQRDGNLLATAKDAGRAPETHSRPDELYR
jgi:hypothetical protein